MRPSVTIIASGLLIQIILTGPGQAGCPDPPHSFASPRLFACPAGDSTFIVIGRSFANTPMPGRWVQLAFRDCDGFHLAPPKAGESFIRDSTGLRIWTTTDVSGIAAFPVSGGGACGSGFIDIGICGSDPPDTALFIPLGTRPVVSPDQNGDLVVDQSDLGLVEAKLGSDDPSADFDGDGVVTEADIAILRAHLGHAAAAATPTRRESWGRLKILYR